MRNAGQTTRSMEVSCTVRGNLVIVSLVVSVGLDDYDERPTAPRYEAQAINQVHDTVRRLSCGGRCVLSENWFRLWTTCFNSELGLNDERRDLGTIVEKGVSAPSGACRRNWLVRNWAARAYASSSTNHHDSIALLRVSASPSP